MKNYDAQSIHNVALVSHGGVGKTSLMEALCYTAKGTTRLGSVANGTSLFDNRPDERERHMTISMGIGFCEWQDHKLNFLDTPGFLDLVGDVKAALAVTESAMVLLDAVSGIQVGTESVLRLVQEAGTPRLFLVNGMDKEGANFETVLDGIKELYGTSVAPVTYPIGTGSSFKGIVNLITQEAFEYPRENCPGAGNKVNIPADLAEKVKTMRMVLMESVAETDEQLMNAYFDKGELSAEEIRQGLAKGMAGGMLYPVLCGSATLNMGTDLILNAAVACCPVAATRKEIEMLNGAQKKVIPCDVSGPLVAFVFKTISEEHIGEFNVVRLFSGKMATGVDMQNSVRSISERPVNMYFPRGRERVETSVIAAGDIGALLKLKGTHTNDTLTEKGMGCVVPPIRFPEPLVSVGVVTKNKGDEDRIAMGFVKLHEEDPTFIYKYYPDIRQSLLSAMGEVHLDIILDNMKSRFKVEVERRPPRISYRETITRTVRYVEYTHKKQSGGAGQYGKVAIDLEPLSRGSGYEFVDKIVGGVIDQPFRPSVDKGIRAKLDGGILAGYPIVDVRVLLVDGKTHPVDSKDIAFQIAGREAFKLAFEQAGPILLEPIVELRVTVPEKYTGDVMGDLSSRRGKINGMEPLGKSQTIIVKVPEAEVLNYSQALRSLTQGRGFYTKSFSHYDPVPNELAKKIIEASKKELAEQSE
ncbi:MAG: elongation factor G [Candidatus Omnitrophica bacterium]|nr:elongation factor G [Candidatus Omnitrophota bacterium]